MVELLGHCYCEARSEAMDAEEFYYDADLDGWVFGPLSDTPRRTMSPRAQFLADLRGITEHTMEPYTHLTCPFCGFDLELPAPT